MRQGEVYVMFLMVAIMCKSSLYLYQYWLPVAIEGPTPVSSLLHSSTIVVAGVYLMMLMPCTLLLVVVVLVLGSNMVRQMDVKKNIAYSTSIHLAVIVLLSVSRAYSVVLVYILLHRIVKGQLFQSSGYEIHGVRSQDMRKFNLNGTTYIILISMFILSALVRMVIIGSKEVVVLRIISLVIVLLMIVSMIYTIIYGNKISVISKVGETEGYYVLLIIFFSILVVDVSFDV